ncbi:hypothetical protein B0T16DRAFT_452408 [Cercophora newfieldiana]|uniref:Uncharacterized protein n=1 Tax=Cercophora newfieldiana TaxID=92897 RepID=A0AA40CZ31_9PEZI|nr:hypothetical protein B0T16DRAFT_452408 [Cercophora newfieldiana]
MTPAAALQSTLPYDAESTPLHLDLAILQQDRAHKKSHNIIYPTSTEPDPLRVIYQTSNLTIWDEYLRVDRVFCDMPEDIRQGVPDDASLVNGMPVWACPPAADTLVSGLGSGSGHIAGLTQGVGMSAHQGRAAKAVEKVMRGVEGVLVVGVMVVGLMVVLGLLAVGMFWSVDKIARWQGGEEDEDEDEEGEEGEGGCGGGSGCGGGCRSDGDEGRERGGDEGGRKGGSGVIIHYGDAIPLVDKPRDAKLAAEKYYL